MENDEELRPKQETLGYICPTTKKQCDDECCVSAEDCHIGAGIDVISEPKQETLEEVTRVSFNLGYDKGTKWQQERMYSEEDMIHFNEWVTIMYPNQRRLLTTSDKRGFYTTKELLVKWFEKFKKK